MAHYDDNDSGEFEDGPSLDYEPPLEDPSGEHGIETSMEIDEEGNEIWYAEDSSLPGKVATGSSANEAIEGLEERRREYRERLRRSREAGYDEDDIGTIPTEDTGEAGIEVSMEVDEQGNEVWFARDSRIPGSSSMGHSVEEAVDGVEDRRKQYREMLRRSREEKRRSE
ncbi:MAG: hypothetical protein ACE5HT_11460 [Gemmatimonadales bacterium]